MTVTQLLLAELEREATGTHRILEQVPEGKNDWKPHETSMPLRALASMVANMPSWLDMVVNMDELDINPKNGPAYRPDPWKTRRDLLRQFEASLQKGREALKGTTDAHLFNTNWKLLSGGTLLQDQLRYAAVRDSVLNHWAHHRGQLVVYMRMNGAKIPALYGPSGDEGKLNASAQTAR